jgi:hypothetical protein
MARQGGALDKYLKLEYYMDMDDGFVGRSTTQNVPVESAVTVSRRLTSLGEKSEDCTMIAQKMAVSTESFPPADLSLPSCFLFFLLCLAPPAPNDRMLPTY